MKRGDLVRLSALSSGLLSYRQLHDIYGMVVGNHNEFAFKIRWFGNYNRTNVMLRKHLKLAKVAK